MDVLIYILYILVAIAVLLLLVLVHELGHYIAGRILKFKITEFSIGFGKAIFSKMNKRGEKISLRIIPLGGYCSFAGEADENAKPQAGDFNWFAPWKRIIVFLAGVFMNFVVAIIFSFIALCTIGGQDLVQVKGIYTNASIDQSAVVLQKDDIIYEVDGIKIDIAFGSKFNVAQATAFANAQNYVSEQEEIGNTEAKIDDYKFKVVVKRNGEMVTLENVNFYTLTKTVQNSTTQEDETVTYYNFGGMSGMEMYETIETDEQGNVTSKKYDFNGIQESLYVHSVGEAAGRCWGYSFGLSWMVLKALWQLFTFQIPISDMGGTITTIQIMAESTRANPGNLLLLIPLISANLGVFNLLPIPALDGAHVVFTIIEWIRKKPINRKVENMIHFVGLLLLFGFIVVIDILHFVL